MTSEAAGRKVPAAACASPPLPPWRWSEQRALFSAEIVRSGTIGGRYVHLVLAFNVHGRNT
jgi:hypothetical protein